MSVELPLAAAAQRLRGRPGRPRKMTSPTPEPTTIMQQIRRLLDLPAAADYLSCSPWTIRDLETAGTLKRVRIPTRDGGELRKLLFDREDLDRLIATWKDQA